MLTRAGGRRCPKGVDLHCETGAGTRTILVRAGHAATRSSTRHPTSSGAEERPWLDGIERLEDPGAGPPLRHLAPPLPAPASIPLGSSAHPGRPRAAPAPRVRHRRARPGLPVAPPAARPATRLRRLVALALHGHRGHRRGACSSCWASWWPSPRAAFGGPSAARVCPHRGSGLANPGTPPDRPLAGRRGRPGRPRRDPGGRRGRCRRAHRRWRAGARAHPPRHRVLRLSRRHLRGGPRAPGPLRAPAHLPAPPPGVAPSRSRPGPTSTSA